MDGIVASSLRGWSGVWRIAKIMLEMDEGAMSWLADEGYDPVFGARPLKRVIQRALQDPLAEMLLAGEVMDGDTVHVAAGADGLIVGDRVSASNRPTPDDAVVH
jgi:ATP-dependent Clp protease ATP-binding subunit ClpB